MKKEKHIESPEGEVHIAGRRQGSFSALLCHPNKHLMYYWPETKKDVTCRICLGKSSNRGDQLTCLAKKAEDIRIRFNGLAKECEHFAINQVFAPISHSHIDVHTCKHRRRLGTKKNPKPCTLADCPLKYER